jgi:hypothetical protein
MAAAAASAALLARLEAISRERPDRVLRLRGSLAGSGAGREPFELLIFRGFSSSLSHPTGFDPDQPALPQDALIEAAELLVAPFDPSREEALAGPEPVDRFLDPAGWV